MVTQGPWRTRPTSSVSATPTASTEGFAGAAFGGNRREYLWLGRQCLCPLEPSQELAWSAWGNSRLPPPAESVPAPPPCRFRELVLGEASGDQWSRSWLGAFPSLFTSIPREESLRNYHKRKLIQDINFF